jgi:predicted double-glycine peptidase
LRNLLSILVAAIAALILNAGPGLAEIRTPSEAGAAYNVQVMSWRDIPFRTVVRQQFDFSCGSAALATLMRFHYGRHTDEAEIFKAMFANGDQAKIRKVGFSMLDMKRYLERQGLTADGFSLTLDQIEKLRTPGIALINLKNYRHFVVIKSVRKDEVLIGDPALGLRKLKRAEFEKMWNGLFFALHGPGTNTPQFGTEGEWRPWSRPMLESTAGDQSPIAAAHELSPLYQISPFRELTQ